MKVKCFDETFDTAYAGNSENFKCSQRWKFRQNDKFVSVKDGKGNQNDEVLNIIYSLIMARSNQKR